jgi:hypothetical protein
VHLGRTYKTAVTAEEKLEFVCRLCGVTSDAMVIGIGVGTSRSPPFGADPEAQDEAAEEAGERALEDMRNTLALARCSACGHRDEAEWRRQKAWFGLRLLGILVLLSAAIWICYRGYSDVEPWFIAAAAGFGLIPAIILGLRQRHHWNSVGQRVTFVRRDPG